MFQGFNASTIMYYEAIRKENSKVEGSIMVDPDQPSQLIIRWG